MPAKKPLSLIMGTGNKSHLTKAEIFEREKNEIKAPSDNIKCPKYITDKNMKKEFKKIAKELVDLKLMSNLDCDALARFLIAQNEYVKITDLLQKELPVINIDGEEIMNENYERLVIVHDKFFKQARAAASDLGLTISSRCKLIVPKTNDDSDILSEGQRRFGSRI